jgi:hypothetical protein
VDSDAPFAGNGSGSRGLLLAPYQEIQEHADERKQEDHENPQQLFDNIHVALEAIDDRDDIQYQNNETS